MEPGQDIRHAPQALRIRARFRVGAQHALLISGQQLLQLIFSLHAVSNAPAGFFIACWKFIISDLWLPRAIRR